MCLLLFVAEVALYSYFAEYLIRVKAPTLKEVSHYMFVFELTGLLGTWLAGKTLITSIARPNVAFLLGCTVLVPLGLFTPVAFRFRRWRCGGFYMPPAC